MLKPANRRHFPRWCLLIGDYKRRATGVWNRGGRKQFSSIKMNCESGWYEVKHVDDIKYAWHSRLNNFK